MSTLKQKFDKKYIDPVGKSVPRIDGLGMVTGQTKYAFDVSFPNMLIGKMIRSPHAHAIIKSIDTYGISVRANDYFHTQVNLAESRISC